MNAQITLWVQDLTSLEKAKEVINSKVPEIQKIAEKVVAEQRSNQDERGVCQGSVSDEIIWTIFISCRRISGNLDYLG